MLYQSDMYFCYALIQINHIDFHDNQISTIFNRKYGINNQTYVKAPVADKVLFTYKHALEYNKIQRLNLLS